MKPKIPKLTALLDAIQANTANFQKPIESRIALFTSPKADSHLDGYVVASRDGGGYAFGDTSFFLNIGVVDDLVVARSTTVHEMYHAVQGFYAAERRAKINQATTSSMASCLNSEHLFADLYEEGSARYVEDFALLEQSHSQAAKQMLSDIRDGVANAEDGSTLLDMSVTSLTASQPLPYDDVYAVGFLGHGLRLVVVHQTEPTVREQARYVEAKRVLSPRWYVAARAGYTHVRPDDTDWNFEVVAGLRPNRLQIIKSGHELYREGGDDVEYDHKVTAQLVSTIKLFSHAGNAVIA
ncbi:hypothetical protein [Granulicella sibirica]|uniref:hypothetical protein n=1 Tax=Granulicella sibirica TaxID=2479048 RepID=UPI001008A567|nr:hypothetical protein [Granulicella sibirica]